MSRRRIVYQEKYRSGAVVLREGCRPVLPCITEGWEVVATEVRGVGRFSDGTEYQDLRVVVKERESNAEAVAVPETLTGRRG